MGRRLKWIQSFWKFKGVDTWEIQCLHIDLFSIISYYYFIVYFMPKTSQLVMLIKNSCLLYIINYMDHILVFIYDY
jgi:hypothetical protein